MVDSIIADHRGDVAFYAENLRTHQVMSRSPDTPVQTASVIKLAILYEGLEGNPDQGKVHFDDRIHVSKQDQVEGSGVLLFFDTPLCLSFRDVLTLMIVMSDNTATNLAIDQLGLDAAIQSRSRLAGPEGYPAVQESLYSGRPAEGPDARRPAKAFRARQDHRS